jgi:hypothetical protein
MILAVAGAEMRSTRRLFRYWLFTILAVLISTALFAQYTVMHGMASYQSATLGAMSPRMLIASVGMFTILVYVAGLIFLAFEVRARDVRDRMTEILDSRPLSNFELVLGKVGGIVLMVWLPLVLITCCFQLFGTVAHLLEFPMGDTIEPWSLLGFWLVALTLLVLWCAAIVLIAVVFRHRLLVAIIAIGLFSLQVWSMFNMPIFLQPMLTIWPVMDISSDILPLAISEGESIRILAHWILAGSLLAFAVALHPRRDGQSFGLASGLGLFVISGVLLGYYSYQALTQVDQIDLWRAAHEAKKAQPIGDMQSLSGTVTIDRGDEIRLDLAIELQAPQGTSLTTLLFTLNPGIEVTGLTVNGENATWQQAEGLVEIDHALSSGANATVHIVAAGTPNEFFGYLDTHFRLEKSIAQEANLVFLGNKTSIFDSDYVAMPPGGHWLPTTGTDVPQSDPRSHPFDYYQLDLEVVIPRGWLVAGPGQREQLNSNDDNTRYRFRPQAPVPHVGLFAAQFEQRTMEAAGIHFEVLFSPLHSKNFELMAPSADLLKERLTELFSNAQSMGITYPYNSLTLVETPTYLRGYGGGWRMDSAQSMPGVMMLRENSFPTARFDRPFGKRPAGEKTAWYENHENGLAGAQLDALERFIRNDFSGGNLFTGVTRNFFAFQTSAVGDGAHAINFVLDALTSSLLTNTTGYFSAHEFESARVLGSEVMIATFARQDRSISENLIDTLTDRPSVWDRALGTPLISLEPTEDPGQALNVLTLKGYSIADSIIAGLGREKAGLLLGTLIERYRGKHFEAADFHALADELELELVPLLGDWLHDTALPGFLVSPAQIVRLTDDAQGRPRYQTTLHLRNDEPAPGLASVSYEWGPRKKAKWDGIKPIRIPPHSSVEIGIVTSTSIYQMYMQPYLSLNREDVPLQINRPDAREQVNAEPFIGNRPSDWQLPQSDDIIVDDLDSGFVISSDRENPTEQPMRFGPGTVKIDMDQGLPQHKAMFGNPAVWSRAIDSQSFGKYRRTYALVQSGEGNQQAIFTVDLPEAGQWRLGYYLSRQFASGKAGKSGARRKGGNEAALGKARMNWSIQRRVGEFQMQLTSNGESRAIEFDAQSGVPGWNDLGEFNLPAGTTTLSISDANTGPLVVADAIRWRPSNEIKQKLAQLKLQTNRLVKND